MSEYDALAADLNLIRRYLTTGSGELQTADQRRFSYIACISALYTAFESFAEQVAFRFGEMLLADPSSISTKQMKSLRSKYVSNASSLLAKSLGVGRYSEITELDIAKSLASCLEDSDSYDLRLELIALHGSNLRWEPLADLFRWAVPDVKERIVRSDAVKHWQSSSGNESGQLLADVLVKELADLVERRNEVAHRSIPAEIVSTDQLLAKVDYVDSLSLGLVASLAGSLLEASVANGESVPLGIPAQYLKDSRVVVIPSLRFPISEGDTVWASGNGITRWGNIQEIRLNDKMVLEAGAGVEVGIMLDFVPPRAVDLHLWQSPKSDFARLPPGIFGSRGPLEG